MYPDAYLNKEDENDVYWFSSPFDPLNNWSAHIISIDGQVFYTLEHAYHWKKFAGNYSEIADQVAQSRSPWAAMGVARKYANKVRPDWNKIKVNVMKELVLAKYEQNKDVQHNLAKTGTRRIIENSPWDSYWGAGKDGKGKNMMGAIWMELRDEKL